MNAPIKRIRAGWVRLGSRGMWHFVRDDGHGILCDSREVALTEVTEWNDEPRGKADACPHCRQKFEIRAAKKRKEERDARVAAEENKEPEVLVAAPESKQMTIAEATKEPAKPLALKGLPPLTTIAQFAEAYGQKHQFVQEFVKERIPNCQRLGTGKLAPFVLDQETQKKIAAEIGQWVENRHKETTMTAKKSPASVGGIHAELASMRILLERIAKELGLT